MSVGNEPAAPVISKGRLEDLGVRAASGIILVIVAIATTRIGGDLFLLVWLVAAAIVLWEWQRLVGGLRQVPRVLVGCVALVLATLLARTDLFEAVGVLAAAAGGLAVLAGVGSRGWAAAGMLYAGFLVMAVAALRFSFPFGSRSIVWLFATVWSTDVFAYFGGRLIGGPKLWPRISPSKTWSGTCVGVCAGALIGTFAAVRDLASPHAILPIFLLTFATAILSQGGDAFESGLKRRFGVKDSSRLIPGHGGVMDRLDGFIAAAIFAFAFGLGRGLPSIAGGLFYWA